MTQLRAMIVGEAWGRSEAMFGHAFIGAAGRELALMLAETGLAPFPEVMCPRCRVMVRLGTCPNCHGRTFAGELEMIAHWKRVLSTSAIALDNVFYHRPPENKVEFFFDKEGDRTLPPLKPGKYIRADWKHHVEGLWKRVTDARPNVVLAFGNTACWALLGQTKISALRGTVTLSPRLGVKVLPSYHPAAILRDWSLRVITVADLTKAAREIEFPEIRRPKRWITAHDHRDAKQPKRIALWEIAAWMANKDITRLSIDIESGYALYSRAELEKMTQKMRVILSNQIAMVGFAYDPAHALVVPFMDRTMPGLNYWPDVVDEARAWRMVIHMLTSSIPKTFQNGMYDIGRFMSIGIVPRMCVHDTMLRHHALYPELLKSLGFLGSIYANEVSWKQMYSNRETLKRDE